MPRLRARYSHVFVVKADNDDDDDDDGGGVGMALAPSGVLLITGIPAKKKNC